MRLRVWDCTVEMGSFCRQKLNHRVQRPISTVPGMGELSSSSTAGIYYGQRLAPLLPPRAPPTVTDTTDTTQKYRQLPTNMKLSSFIMAAGFLSTLSAAVPAPTGLTFAKADVATLVGTRRLAAVMPRNTSPTGTTVETVTPTHAPTTASMMER